MGVLTDVNNVWSKSGSDSGSVIDKVLGVAEKVMDTVNQVVNIFTTAKEHKNVITDYRKASVHLPKYYLEQGGEKVATIEVIEAIGGDEKTGNAKETSPNKYIQDLLDRKTKDTFILENIQEVFAERYQVVETFGEDFGVFLTGERPKVFTYSGVLVNDAYRGWKSKFVAAYQALLRGSKLAQKRLKVKLVYDYVEVEGYVIELATNMESTNEVDVKFTFQVLVTGYNDLGLEKFNETPAYGGQLGWPLDSTALSRLASDVLIQLIPGLAGSGYESVIGGVIDDLFNKFVPKGTNSGISGKLSKAGDIFGSATQTAGVITGLLGAAFAAKAATSSEKAPETASLLGETSKSVSGGFGDMLTKVTGVNKQFGCY